MMISSPLSLLAIRNENVIAATKSIAREALESECSELYLEDWVSLWLPGDGTRSDKRYEVLRLIWASAPQRPNFYFKLMGKL